MEEFIEDWKKLTINTIAENGAFIHYKNNTIMDAIINYENTEIAGKEGVKKAIYLVVSFFYFDDRPSSLDWYNKANTY